MMMDRILRLLETKFNTIYLVVGFAGVFLRRSEQERMGTKLVDFTHPANLNVRKASGPMTESV